MTPGTGELRALLAELRELVPADDVPDVDELARRLDQQALRVVVAGEAKRGKSTLVNALLGRDVVPSGVVPLTAVTATIRHGPSDLVVARFADGVLRELPLSALPDLVTEQGNPGNRRGVGGVTVQVPAPLLAGGLELVDTPGVGSVHEHNTTEAMTALERMDAAILVLTADPPISASERAFLREIRERAVAVFCVLNKVDRLEPDEQRQALAFTRQVVAAELGAEVTVFALSARAGLRGTPGHDGFAAFAAAFAAYLDTAGAVDLARSVAAHAARAARSVTEVQQAILAALADSVEDVTARVWTFRGARLQVDRQRAETAALAAAEFDRLQAETDAQAAALLGRERPALRRDVTTWVAAAGGPAAQMEAEVMQHVAERIQGIVDPWRDRRGEDLRSAVHRLDQRMAARLTEHITEVRDVAARLFDFTMPPAPPPAELATTAGFRYSFTADPGPIDSLTTALRRRLPAGLARRQVERYATDRADQLLDRHVGRCRAAFQAQLADTRRRFVRELDRRFAEGAGRIAEAIEMAVHLRTAEQARVAAARAEAGSILDRARRVAARCDALARPDRPAEVSVPELEGSRCGAALT